MSWQQAKRVNDLVEGMKFCHQPYIIVRYSSQNEVCSDGQLFNGFLGYRVTKSNSVQRGTPMLEGKIHDGDTMRFFSDKYGICYAAIPDCKHNRDLLKNSYGEAPFEIEECEPDFKKALDECKKKNIQKQSERNPKHEGPDGFNVTIPAKPPEGLQDKKAIIDKLMSRGENVNITNNSKVTTAKS